MTECQIVIKTVIDSLRERMTQGETDTKILSERVRLNARQSGTVTKRH